MQHFMSEFKRKHNAEYVEEQATGQETKQTMSSSGNLQHSTIGNCNPSTYLFGMMMRGCRFDHQIRCAVETKHHFHRRSAGKSRFAYLVKLKYLDSRKKVELSTLTCKIGLQVHGHTVVPNQSALRYVKYEPS